VLLPDKSLAEIIPYENMAKVIITIISRNIPSYSSYWDYSGLWYMFRGEGDSNKTSR
jgi:hypothetical protein